MYTPTEEIARRERLLQGLSQGQQPRATNMASGLAQVLTGFLGGRMGKQNSQALQKNADIRKDEMNQLMTAMNGGINAPMQPGQTRELQHPDAQALQLQMALQKQRDERQNAAALERQRLSAEAGTLRLNQPTANMKDYAEFQRILSTQGATAANQFWEAVVRNQWLNTGGQFQSGNNPNVGPATNPQPATAPPVTTQPVQSVPPQPPPQGAGPGILASPQQQPMGLPQQPAAQPLPASIPIGLSPAQQPSTIGAQSAARTAGASGGLNLTPGEKKVDEDFASRFNDFASVGGYADVMKNTNQLQEVGEMLESGENLTGPALGLIPDWAKAFVNPGSLNAQEQIAEVVQRNLRVILGAQFTEKEGERLVARAFNPRLEEDVNRKRVGALLKQMALAAEQMRDSSEYFKAKGTLKDYPGQIPSLADFQNVDFDADTSQIVQPSPAPTLGGQDIDSLINEVLSGQSQ